MAAEIMEAPSRTRETPIAIPRHARPVELKSLHLKLCSGIFKIIALLGVFFVVEKPKDWIDVDTNINRMGLEPLSFRRGYYPKPFRASGANANPPLREFKHALPQWIAIGEVWKSLTGLSLFAIEESLDEC